MHEQNPYAAPQTPLQTVESSSVLPALPLPFDFAKGAKTLLITAWNPLAFVLLNVAYTVHETLAPISVAIIFAIAIRGYLPFCRAETNGKNVFRVATVMTALCYLLFVLTFFRVFSYHESALRNTLLCWLIGNAIMTIGLHMVAKEYRQVTLRKWAFLAFVLSLLLFASLLPLQTQWLGFEVLHTYAAWYYFVGFSYFITNFVTLIQICTFSLEHTEQATRLKFLRDE